MPRPSRRSAPHGQGHGNIHRRRVGIQAPPAPRSRLLPACPSPATAARDFLQSGACHRPGVRGSVQRWPASPAPPRRRHYAPRRRPSANAALRAGLTGWAKRNATGSHGSAPHAAPKAPSSIQPRRRLRHLEQVIGGLVVGNRVRPSAGLGREVRNGAATALGLKSTGIRRSPDVLVSASTWTQASMTSLRKHFGHGVSVPRSRGNRVSAMT